MSTQKQLKKREFVKLSCRLPYSPKNNQRAIVLRKTMTDAERKLWYCFLKRQVVPVYRQRPIAHYIVDFYVPRLKLVIELDGSQHYEDAALKYDAQRTEVLTSMGLHVIRFANADIMYNFEHVCSILLHYLSPPLGEMSQSDREG